MFMYAYAYAYACTLIHVHKFSVVIFKICCDWEYYQNAIFFWNGLSFYLFKKRVDSLPKSENLVTWLGLEDALNGIRGDFAAFSQPSKLSKVSSVGECY